MNSLPELTLDGSRKGLIKRNPGEYDFYKAVMEFAEFVIPYILSIPRSQQRWVCQSRRCDDGLWSDVNYMIRSAGIVRGRSESFGILTTPL